MKRTSKKQIHELEKHAREIIDANARLYARYEYDASGNAYAFINGRMYIYKSNSAMYDAVADMVLHPDETAAAQDEAEKATEEACKAIEAAASGDAAAIAKHYSAAEEHADNARSHARKAHTYAADEAARNAAIEVLEAELAISELAYTIGEALADEANATNAERMSAHNAAFAELIAHPWTATAEDRAAVAAMVQAIAKGAAVAKADAAAASFCAALENAIGRQPYDMDAAAVYRVARDEIAGWNRASETDHDAVTAMVEAIAQR